jgi:hypothetical protein
MSDIRYMCVDKATNTEAAVPVSDADFGNVFVVKIEKIKEECKDTSITVKDKKVCFSFEGFNYNLEWDDSVKPSIDVLNGQKLDEGFLTSKTGVAETGAAESSTAESGVAESGVAESGTVKTITESSTAGTAESGTAKTITESSTVETGTAESSTAESGTAETGTAESSTAESGTAETGAAGTAETGAAGTAESGTAAEKPIVRRGVDNVGNSCWANGIYQMLYDAEKFRNYIIDTNWDQGFFTKHATEMDKIVSSFGTFTEADKQRKKELEDSLKEGDDRKEFETLEQKEKDANPTWSWLPKDISPDEYKNIFGHLLKQIFKYIRGDNDLKITYETSLIPVLLFPDVINDQHDSSEFINLLNSKAESLDLKKYFGLNQTETKYYLDGENKTDIKLTNNLEPLINAILKFDDKNKLKTDLSVKQMLSSKETVQNDDGFTVATLEELKEKNTGKADTDLQIDKIVNKNVTTYNNIIPEYSDFSDYFLVSLSRVDNDRNKIKTPVKFDDNLNNGKTKFTLLGVVVHLGDKSGHYIYESIVANKECNDSNAENPAFTNYSKEEVEKNWTILLYKKEGSILESTADKDAKSESVFDFAKGSELVIPPGKRVTGNIGGSSDSDMPMERPPVSGGSRKKRKQKSKKSRRSKKK